MTLRTVLFCAIELGLCLLAAGCTQQKEVITVTAEGQRVSDAEIDKDAFQLLPEGPIMLFRVDAEKLFKSDFGAELSQLLTDALPFAEGAGVQPDKDLDVLVGGVYATVGSDIIFVCRGRFHKQATADAIAKNPKSQLGHDIVSLSYAGESMYVSQQAAMAVLTDKTMVFGTQLGVRRVLEGIEEGRLARHLPDWFESMLKVGAADFQLGIDLDAQPVPASMGEQIEVFHALRAGRLLGNFRSPGLNFAGTLTYRDPESAEKATEKINNVQTQLDQYEMIMLALKIPQPIVRLEAEPTGKETRVVAELRGEAVATGLRNATQLMAGTEAGTWLPK